MVRLPLEFLLEQGFEALGVEFKPRVYAEELLAGASVDDVLSGRSIAEHESYVRGLVFFDDFEYFGSLCDLTDVQRHALDFDEAPVFFLRVSGDYNDWSVEYIVSSTVKRSCYEKEAERIVREGLIDDEVVHVRFKGLDVVSVVRAVQPDGSDDVFVYGIEHEKLKNFGFEGDLRNALAGRLFWLPEFERLNQKPFDPVELYKVLFNFIKEPQ